MLAIRFAPPLVTLALLSGAAYAQSFTPLTQFPGGGDGLLPYGALTAVNGKYYTTTEFGGAYGRGAVIEIDPKGGAETVLYSFKGGADGYFPQAGLAQAGKLLYGTTAYGGAGNLGTVYSIDPASGAEQIVFSFTQTTGGNSNTPVTSLGGTLFGETYNGGTNNLGTVFKIDPKTGAETTLYSFQGGNDGCYGSYGAMVPVGSLLYGTTLFCGAQGGGVVFSIDPATGAELVVHSFSGADGYAPYGGVTASGSTLYGTTDYGGVDGAGTVYSVDTTTGTETVIYSFTDGPDGGVPQDAPVFVSGKLYGTAYLGGGGFGTVFEVNASSGAETTLYTFTGGADGGFPQAPLVYAANALYGTSLGPETLGGNAGTVFAVNIKKKAETTLHQFLGPHPFFQSNVFSIAGTSGYGTTENGGAANAGSIYSINAGTGALTTLYSFSGGADGAGPVGGLIASGGFYYGVTTEGGNANQGTLFAYNMSSGTKSTLYAFSGSDGARPNGPLLLSGSLLYGTTDVGGANGLGSIFSFDTASGKLTTIYSFTGGADGAEPLAPLIIQGATLYGETYVGGADGNGTVFSVATKSGKETTLHSFAGGSDGAQPYGGLVYSSGTLYGVTVYGGGCSFGYGCGTVFSVNAKTGAEKILHEFTGGTDGLFPSSALTIAGTLLYGTSEDGGANGVGALFSIDLKSKKFATAFSFADGPDGESPGAPLLNLGSFFVGTTNFGGTNGAGTIFNFTP
jgi:uncharacterized repeat protein (TIGR03803 family)